MISSITPEHLKEIFESLTEKPKTKSTILIGITAKQQFIDTGTRIGLSEHDIQSMITDNQNGWWRHEQHSYPKD